MRFYLSSAFCLFSFLSIIFFPACQRERVTDDPSSKVTFTTDTLNFDTVFVDRGSVTRFFKVKNPHRQRINISQIRLKRLQGEQFRMNVDGVPGDVHENIEILPRDSVWIFVEVDVNPTDVNNPFVILDEVEFVTNGNVQNVVLRAWGQNAYFHFGETIESSTTWKNDRPHVLVGNADFPGVHVDTGVTLTIEPGAQIFSHANAGLFVSGTLNINGSVQDSVIFEGDRLEPSFDDIPGQWLGVFILRGSTGNTIDYTCIKEAAFGLSVGSSFNNDLATFDNASRPDVVLNNTSIKFSFNNGIFGFNADIAATNCLFYRSADNLMAIGLGGSYNFNHCTFFNSGGLSVDHEEANWLLANVAGNDQALFVNDLQASFTNCINVGSLDEEVELNNETSGGFDLDISHCMIRSSLEEIENIAQSSFVSRRDTLNARFVSQFNNNFRLNETSILIDAGSSSGTNIDFEGNPRPVGDAPDIGAYEFE